MAPATVTPKKKLSSTTRLAIIIPSTVVVAAIGLALVFLHLRERAEAEEDQRVIDDVRRKAKSAVEEATARAGAKIKKLRGIIDGSPTAYDCSTLYVEGDVPKDLCEGLVTAIENGRTTPKGRHNLRTFLKERGYFRLRGFVVGSIAPNTYEINRHNHRLHSILETNLTSYTTRGTFALWAKKATTREVETKHGFTQTWDLFREDPFGSVVQKVFDAPAGRKTSDAARTALQALLTVSIMSFGGG